MAEALAMTTSTDQPGIDAAGRARRSAPIHGLARRLGPLMRPFAVSRWMPFWVRIPAKAISQSGVFDHPRSEAAERPTLGRGSPPDDHLLSGCCG